MIDLGKADRQRPERYRPPEAPADPVEAFRRAMADHGLEPGDIEPSGKLVRVDVEKRGDKAGWYVFFPGDIAAGAFGNWKTGLKQNWCSKDRHVMTDAESARYKAMIADAKRQRQEETERLQAAAKARAWDIWNTAEPASPDHPYLAKKGVPPHGLKQSRGSLVVPVMDETGTLWNLQFIRPDGTKKFLSGGRVEGCSFTIPGDGRLSICEGYSTGATINQANGSTVICAFNAGNLPNVAAIVRQKCPTASIVICADNDRFTAGNPGLSFANKAARQTGAVVSFPCFDGIPGGDDPECKLTDFNDLCSCVGLEAVNEQISAPGQKQRLPPLTPKGSAVLGRLKARPAPLEFIFRYNEQGLIPKGVVGVLTATGGTGKTFWLLSLAMAGAAGSNFGPINAPRPIKTLVIVGEDTQDELDRRLWDIGKGRFPERLHAASVYGELGPLMRLEGSAPVLADAYYWLDETIKNHDGLELLILDPKSRFYGLDENNSDHATQWIQALESLSKRYGLTILFSHHTSKDNAGKISQNMSRGASAIVDGCRWQAGLVRMDPDTAKKYGIENPRSYVLFDAPKSNYAADLPGLITFKRGEGGVLEYCEPGQTHINNMCEALLEMLRNDPEEYTKRHLVDRKKGSEIAKEMKESFPGFKRITDMERIINTLIRSGQLEEKPGPGGGMILKPTTPF